MSPFVFLYRRWVQQFRFGPNPDPIFMAQAHLCSLRHRVLRSAALMKDVLLSSSKSPCALAWQLTSEYLKELCKH